MRLPSLTLTTSDGVRVFGDISGSSQLELRIRPIERGFQRALFTLGRRKSPGVWLVFFSFTVLTVRHGEGDEDLRPPRMSLTCDSPPNGFRWANMGNPAPQPPFRKLIPSLQSFVDPLSVRGGRTQGTCSLPSLDAGFLGAPNGSKSPVPPFLIVPVTILGHFFVRLQEFRPAFFL